MGGLGNALIEPRRHNIDTRKKILHNGEVSILGPAKVNINWIKVPLKQNLYDQTDGSYKTCRINKANTKKTAEDRTFQGESTENIAMNEIVFHFLNYKNEPREYGRWSSIIL